MNDYVKTPTAVQVQMVSRDGKDRILVAQMSFTDSEKAFCWTQDVIAGNKDELLDDHEWHVVTDSYEFFIKRSNERSK